MNITVTVIPHYEQRYDTPGDWKMDTVNRKLDVKVSDLDNWRMNFLMAFHEIIEAVLCFDRGISGEEVDKFDMHFEAHRDIDDIREPGDSPDAPYKNEHFFATSLERLMAAELRVDWFKYEDEILKLS